MKKLLVVLLALGSLSAFSNTCPKLQGIYTGCTSDYDTTVSGITVMQNTVNGVEVYSYGEADKNELAYPVSYLMTADKIERDLSELVAPEPDIQSATHKSYCENGKLVNHMYFLFSDRTGLTALTTYNINKNGDLVIKSTTLQTVETTTCKRI